MSDRRIPARRLPRQPNLQQLRKQAKELLEESRASGAGPAGFTLSDAQRELACAYGYDSWPKLKAFVDGANVARMAEAVKSGDIGVVRSLLKARPELVGMDMAGNDEHRALHYAVVRRDAAMVRLLMQAGADARKGIFPHRDATTAVALATDREYLDIAAVIEEEEQRRRERMSSPNAAVSPVQEEINDAIRQGNHSAAMALLVADESLVRACDRNGGTPLHVAAQTGSSEMVAWLLHKQADPCKQDLSGLTPLDRAAMAADPRNDGAARFPAVARLLLEAGATVTIRSAVALGDAARVRELVGQDAGLLDRDIHWGRGGLLSLAVRHGHPEMVRLLLDLGADVNERTTLDELEEPTESWGQPLWMAALAGRRDIAELLLNRGADPNANLYASGWPLDHAYRQRDEAMKQLLLDRGAKPKPWTVTLAHDLDAARRMLDTDASEEVASELTWSACSNGCPEIVAMALPRLTWPASDPRWDWILIQPPRSAGDDGEEEAYFACMELLLAHGIDPNVSSRFGQTVLHFTAARGTLSEAARVRFAAMLLDHGAKLDVRDELLGSTPLGWACRWGREEMARLLIARGAPVLETDAEPWATPLAWATKMGHSGIARILRERAERS
jgi:ankyrin repeat protein